MQTGPMRAASLRPADVGDSAWMAACAEAAYRPYVAVIGRRPAPMDANFARHIANGEAWIWQAAGSDRSQEPQGYAILLMDADCLLIDTIALLPAVQGQGEGRKLMAACEAWGRGRGCKTAKLYTNAKMLSNQRFYPALGYQETGRRHDDGFDRIFYAKSLATES